MQIEIIATIVALLVAVKLIFVLTKPEKWLNMAKVIYSKPTAVMFISVILAVAVLGYLIEKLSIIDIFAVMAFIALMSIASVSYFGKDVIAVGEKMIKQKFVSKIWLPLLIWIILLVWVIVELI